MLVCLNAIIIEPSQQQNVMQLMCNFLTLKIMSYVDDGGTDGSTL